MSRKQRRKLGVNIISIAKAVRELSEEGFAPESNQDFSEKILEKISEKKLPQLTERGIDIDAILAFIQKVLPIILALLGVFAGIFAGFVQGSLMVNNLPGGGFLTVTFTIPWLTIIVLVSATLITTIFSSRYPAKWAANLNIIDAVRTR